MHSPPAGTGWGPVGVRAVLPPVWFLPVSSDYVLCSHQSWCEYLSWLVCVPARCDIRLSRPILGPRPSRLVGHAGVGGRRCPLPYPPGLPYQSFSVPATCAVMDLRTSLVCKSKRRYLLTLQAPRYCILAVHGRPGLSGACTRVLPCWVSGHGQCPT